MPIHPILSLVLFIKGPPWAKLKALYYNYPCYFRKKEVMELRKHKSYLQLSLLGALTLILTACIGNFQKDGPPAIDVDAANIPNAVPHNLPKSRYGNPDSYVVYGHRYYVLNSAKGYVKRGIASWYGTKFHGQPTSSREPYDMFAMTAASRTL